MAMAKSSARVTLDHIGLASADLTASLAQLGDIFPEPASAVEEVPAEGVRLAFIDVGGPKIEVLESTREGSAVARYLEKRPPGVHHISFRIEGVPIDDWFAELRDRGVRVLGDGPSDGSNGTRIFFVHPESTAGVLVEFAQSGAKTSTEGKA
jgi:methylmalonyl-CoA/ethylmalonyl-CoA epimerase